jgi:hypothetical protein
VSEVPTQHKMAYIGYEPERETLKYRCPAKHEGWDWRLPQLQLKCWRFLHDIVTPLVACFQPVVRAPEIQEP